MEFLYSFLRCHFPAKKPVEVGVEKSWLFSQANSSRVFFKGYTGRGSCNIDCVQILGKSGGHAPPENFKDGITDNEHKFVIRSWSKAR